MTRTMRSRSWPSSRLSARTETSVPRSVTATAIADRGALDAQQVVRDLGDHVAVVLAHVPDGRDPHRARHLHVQEGVRRGSVNQSGGTR